MSQRELDEAIAQVVNEPVDRETVRESAGRVFRQLFDSTFIAGDQVDKIRTCDDVQALLPAYRAGALSKPRALLIEDHLVGCPACRRAAHPQQASVLDIQAARRRNPRHTARFAAYALAASLLVGIGIGVLAASRGILPGQHKLQATVESVQGGLYRVSDYGASLVEAGAIIRNAEELKTAKGSRAILRLSGGARLELGERSDVSVTASWRGPDVNLQRGRMIVQADTSVPQSFYISTGDVVIPIRGTVVAVNHGVKGSRISVAHGSAQVERGTLRRTLYAGQQFTTSHAVYTVPVASEFDWSQNSAEYAALLNQLSGLQKDLESIPSPGLRYTCALAPYLPANTIVYAAIPNLGSTLTQAKQMFDSRLAESEVLRNWWRQQSVSQNGRFDTLIGQINSLTAYLGDEVVVGMAATGNDKHAEPVILAALRQPGLANFIKNNLPADAHIQVLGPSDLPSSNSGLLVRLDHNVLVASSNWDSVRQVEALLQSGAAGPFTATPLYARVKDVYSNGAGYFLAADLERITGKSVTGAKDNLPLGLDNAQFLVLERKDVSGSQQMRASLSFDGNRQGIASGLASPGPVGSLDFVSPGASFAVALAMRNPKSLVQELLNYDLLNYGGFAAGLSQFETASGISVLNDLAAPLGSDATFAVDGPGLPVAAWKVAIEVYDPERLKSTFATLVDRFNQYAAPAGGGTLQLTHHQVNGSDVYAISNSKSALFSFNYVFVDGYWVAAANEANLMAAIQNKRAGQTLANSSTFRAKLPADRFTNFSAVLYQNFANTLKPVSDQMSSANVLTQQQKQALAAFANSGPGLICLYGEPSSITAASSGSFLGFNLGTLAGVYQGKPVAPLIAGNAGLFKSPGASKN